jgi:hypothetical protein
MKGAASFRDATQRAARPEAFFVIDHRFLTGRRRGSPAADGVTIRALPEVDRSPLEGE